ncbi:helix-turn-helix domain-containing protein [Dactylosporangium sp. CA-152071]|uniref:helix-turn-helix domain-containing protein n=1 Tax=Dactylosporangium sp. CA-152071 TaxID=3239933 RepID=UPI003D8B5988
MGQAPRQLTPEVSPRHTFGARLRQCREQQGLSQAQLAAKLFVSADLVAKVEKAQRRPSQRFVESCDMVLGAGGALARFLPELVGDGERTRQAPPPDNVEGVDDMRRRAVLQAMAALAVSSPGSSHRVPEPQVGRLEDGADALRRLYHECTSPRDLLALVRSHLDATADVLRQLPSGPLRQRTLSNRSEVSTLAGRLAFFDLHSDNQARGYFGLAHEAALQAENDALAAAALGHLAFVPAREGNVAASMDYLSGAARHAAASGVTTLQSWVTAIESELVTAVAPTLALQALERATDLIAQPNQAPVPVWLDYYSADRLAGFHGYTLLQLGRGGDARAVLTAALNGLELEAVKQRAVFLADIATSYLTSEDPDVDQACAVATEGIASLQRFGYATGAERLHAIGARLRPWEDQPAVRDFDERLAALTS